MKGKRYATEDKIRILRQANRGEKSIQDVCQEESISEASFHRWKRQFGQMDPKIYDVKSSAFTKLKKFVTVNPNMN